MTTSRISRLAPALVGGLTFVAFLPALGAGFVNWDDPQTFLNNPRYRGLGWAQLKWMFSTTLGGHYIPLTWLTLGLNYVLGGMEPWGYHFGNVLLHAGNATLLYLVAGRLLTAGFGEGTSDRAAPIVWGAAVAALAFGVHPLRAESVAWVTERRDVLCGCFYLLAILAYLRGVEGGSVLRGRWRLASVGLLGLALLAKAMAMTLPLTLLLLDVYPLRRRRLGWRVLLTEKTPYFGLAGAGAILAFIAQAHGTPIRSYAEYGPRARLAMVGYSLWFYPWKMAWPEGLSPLYELPARVEPLQWRFLGAMVAVAVVTVGLAALRHRFPGGLTAWAHSAIVLAPVSGVVHSGYQLAHDRYSYLSGLGFAVVAGAGVTWTLRERERMRGWVSALALAVAVFAVAGWGVATWRQSAIWRSSERLWRHAVSVDPGCALCLNSLGVAILETAVDDKRMLEAEAHFRQAILVRPDYPNAYYNLGFLLASARHYGEAEGLFKEYIRLQPLAAEGPERLGMLYVDEGRCAEAIPLLRRALALKPDLPLARADLDRALDAVGAARAPTDRRRDGSQ